jgi:hypothetical protein
MGLAYRTIIRFICLSILLIFVVAVITLYSIPMSFSQSIKVNKTAPFFGIWAGKAIWTNYISDEFYHLWKDLEDVHGWRELANLSSQNRVWLANDTLTSYFYRYFNRIPSLILYVEAFDTIMFHSELPDWRSIQHPWLFLDDIHTHTAAAAKVKQYALMTVEHVITTYPYKLDEEYSRKNDSNLGQWMSFHRTWLPHSASMSFVVKYNRNPIMKIFLSGAINHHYPYRQLALQMYNDMSPGSLNNTIEYHEHPGYKPLTNITQWKAGNNYARLINRYFVAMTDTSSKNYIVAKVFEIPVAGALLLLNSEAIPILARLQWFENVHYVAYNKTNIRDIFSDIVSARSFSKYEKIRWTGHCTALKLHTTQRRSLFLHKLALNNYQNQ